MSHENRIATKHPDAPLPDPVEFRIIDVTAIRKGGGHSFRAAASVIIRNGWVIKDKSGGPLPRRPDVIERDQAVVMTQEMLREQHKKMMAWATAKVEATVNRRI